MYHSKHFFQRLDPKHFFLIIPLLKSENVSAPRFLKKKPDQKLSLQLVFDMCQAREAKPRKVHLVVIEYLVHFFQSRTGGII